ncbi:MAG: bile acid:sodium symporter, partial [Pirellulaceae bacterium]
MKQIRKQWFLIGLLSALVIGYVARQPLSPIAQAAWLRSAIVASVLFLMGLVFSMQALVRSLRNPKAAMLATGLNILAVPAIAYLLSRFLPASLGGGLIVASAVPCTLASASLWTRRAGGDDAVSMMVTVFTNLLCFVIAPTTLILLLGKSAKIDFVDQVTKLGLLVVVPLCVAQILRRSPHIVHSVAKHKSILSIAAQTGILIMVALGMVVTSQRIAASETSVQFGAVAWMIVLAALLHLIVLGIGWYAAQAARLSRPQQIAVAI